MLKEALNELRHYNEARFFLPVRRTFNMLETFNEHIYHDYDLPPGQMRLGDISSAILRSQMFARGYVKVEQVMTFDKYGMTDRDRRQGVRIRLTVEGKALLLSLKQGIVWDSLRNRMSKRVTRRFYQLLLDTHMVEEDIFPRAAQLNPLHGNSFKKLKQDYMMFKLSASFTQGFFLPEELATVFEAENNWAHRLQHTTQYPKLDDNAFWNKRFNEQPDWRDPDVP